MSGVSQTEANMPRILKDFDYDLLQSSLLTEEMKTRLEALHGHLNNRGMRIYHGGVYTWQPSKWQYGDRRMKSLVKERATSLTSVEKRIESNVTLFEHGGQALSSEVRVKRDFHTDSGDSCWTKHRTALPYLIVLLAAVTGMTISALVPPDGIGCRHMAQIRMLVVWLVSADLDLFL